MSNTNINEEIKYLNRNYNFENDFTKEIILSELYKFLDKDDIKRFCLLNKNIHKSHCNQIETLKINKGAETLNLEKLFNNYNNINNLDLSECSKIKDFTPISTLKELTNLNVSYTNISDISFLENNKNIEELNLQFCFYIKDYSPLSKLEKLEILKAPEIPDISFLEKNNNIKELQFSTKFKDLTLISKLTKLEVLKIRGEISDISFLKQNKNIKNLNLFFVKILMILQQYRN